MATPAAPPLRRITPELHVEAPVPVSSSDHPLKSEANVPFVMAAVLKRIPPFL